jgi:cholestenol delta-isomerase
VRTLSIKDRLTIGLLAYFMLVASVLELWWVLHSPAEKAALRGHSVIGRVWELYGACDRGYFDAPSPLAWFLETVNVCFTQPLNLLLIYAIVRAKPYRWTLQLAMTSYYCFALILYFAVAHLSGYAMMRERSPYTFFLFYGSNGPWLLSHLWLWWEAARAVTRRFAAAS